MSLSRSEIERTVRSRQGFTQYEDDYSRQKVERSRLQEEASQREENQRRLKDQQDYQRLMSDLRLKREYARKEGQIKRPLNIGEMRHFAQTGKYPASEAAEIWRRTDFDILEHNYNFNPYDRNPNALDYKERERRIKEARSRTPLENAIRRWFTPIKTQVPEKYLK
jgi:hypothetical protein